MNELLSSDYISFFGRLTIYSACALWTGGYFLGLLWYLFLDLVVMDIALNYICGLKKLASGLDSIFLELSIINCFYITLDRKMDSIQEVKE